MTSTAPTPFTAPSQGVLAAAFNGGGPTSAFAGALAWIRLVGLLMFLPPHLEEPLRTHGLNFFEYSIKAALSDATDRQLSMTYLSDLTHGSLSRLSHAIKRLESRGWVCRRPAADHARAKAVALTDEGLATMAATAPDHVARPSCSAYGWRPATELAERATGRPISPDGASDPQAPRTPGLAT